jgi:hypothetical protein
MEAVGWVPWRVDPQGLHCHGEQRTAGYLNKHGGGASVAVDDLHGHSLRGPGDQSSMVHSHGGQHPWLWRSLHSHGGI